VISVDDLLKLAASGSDKLARLGELATRLAALDIERGEIMAELGQFGVTVTHDVTAPAAPAAPVSPTTPLCEICGEPATETVDDTWYCEEHGTAVVIKALPAPKRTRAKKA